MRPDRHANDGNMIAADEHYSDREDVTPCGGCGATSSDDRCIGCLHDFGDEASDWVKRGRKWREEE